MLTAKKIEKLKSAGRYRDGLVRGLYLQVGSNGAKSWLLRYELRGRERMLGLGSASTFTLKEARERAFAARRQLADGIDPVDAKAAAKAAFAKAMTFSEAADRYFTQHEGKWSNATHRAQFLDSMRKYAFPVIGSLPVAAVDTALVIKILEQDYKGKTFWNGAPETASRVRNRIESVLDWAAVRGYRTGDNPARWKGYLDQVLPGKRQLARTEHHAAMAYGDVPAFMAELSTRNSVAAAALRFLILTAARTAEVTGARWSEIDLDTAVWTIPAERMKARTEHRVPIAKEAVELLRSIYIEDDNPHVFIGSRAGTGLSALAMFKTLKRTGRTETVHGFRSSFRTWAAERTAYPREVCEQALAHTVGSAVERAYARTSLFDHRRRLMAEWAQFCCSPPATGEVVPLRGGR